MILKNYYFFSNNNDDEMGEKDSVFDFSIKIFIL